MCPPFGDRPSNNLPAARPSPNLALDADTAPLLPWMRRTRNGAFNARPPGDTCWLYLVWDPPDDPDPAPLMIRSPAKRLDHAKREAAAAPAP